MINSSEIQWLNGTLEEKESADKLIKFENIQNRSFFLNYNIEE